MSLEAPKNLDGSVVGIFSAGNIDSAGTSWLMLSSTRPEEAYEFHFRDVFRIKVYLLIAKTSRVTLIKFMPLLYKYPKFAMQHAREPGLRFKTAAGKPATLGFQSRIY